MEFDRARPCSFDPERSGDFVVLLKRDTPIADTKLYRDARQPRL
jgi:hypothetical protein